MQQRPFPHFRKHQQIEEMHPAENEEHDSHLLAECFQNSLQIQRHVSLSQSQADIPDINQVEADDEEVIDGVSQGLITMKRVHQEHSAILVERFGHPDGESHADDEIDDVGPDDRFHMVISFYCLLFIYFQEVVKLDCAKISF